MTTEQILRTRVGAARLRNELVAQFAQFLRETFSDDALMRAHRRDELPMMMLECQCVLKRTARHQPGNDAA